MVRIRNEDLDRSWFGFLVREIRSLMALRNTCIAHVRRNNNIVNHTLAHYGRTSGRIAVWLGSGPDGFVELCNSECSLAT